jgi:hypothetical protein
MNAVLKGIAAELAALDYSRKALRSFGLVVGGVFVGIAAILVWRSGWALGPIGTTLLVLGSTLAAFGLAFPRALRPVYRAWMGLALVLGYVMTRVLLTVVCVTLFIPIGLALRLVGKDLLGIRLDERAPTYWQPREERLSERARMERYF